MMERAERLRLYAETLRVAVQERGVPVTGWEYTLTKGVMLPLLPFDDLPREGVILPWLSIIELASGWTITLKRGYSTDGCTGAPDFSRGATLSRVLYLLEQEGQLEEALRLAGPFVAHWAHDALYQFAAEIARAWGCSVWAVIRWANRNFAWHMVDCGTPEWQRRLYAGAVELVGHQFAWLTRTLRAVCPWRKG